MPFDALLDDAARSLAALVPALERLRDEPATVAARDAGIARGYFAPDEEALLLGWFARYLGARAALLEMIDELRPIALGGAGAVDEAVRRRGFLMAYLAACQLVAAGRYLLEEFATHRLVQRKLNEGAAGRRIPRKQYTRVYRSITDPAHVWRLAQARCFADEHRLALEGLAAAPELADLVAALRRSEPALDVTGRKLAGARLRYRWHAWRRRRASAVQQGLFGILEAFGRVIADVRPPWHVDRLRDAARAALESLLEPGDVLVTRHDRALSNLFLPGFWPHAALHLGPAALKVEMGLEGHPRGGSWVDPLRVLEARKDGVRLRPLPDTLAVDAVAVLRPALERGQVAEALRRALDHEGKLYNFDFDFFRSDRLVCTEVVYRAYEGIGSIRFPLRERVGRLTLSAEDLVRVALEGDTFEPVAVFGTPHTPRRLATGRKARRALAKSLGSLESRVSSLES